jgi:PAS domain S-box-containing protein
MTTDEAPTKRILLVEDEALVALSEKETLENHGYEVVAVHSGEKAVETIHSDSGISLVLMDIDLGEGLDGTEAAQQILELRELPILFLTNHSEKAYVDLAKTINNYGYVLKNSGEFVLVESIEMAYELFEAHQETKREKKQYRLLAENTYEMVTTLDDDFNTLYVSPSVSSLLGYTQKEYLAKTTRDVLTPDSYQRAMEAYRDRRAGDFSPKRLELEYIKKDGETIWCEAITRPLLDEDGSRLGSIVSVRDIAERKETETALQESQKQLETIFNTANDAIFIHDFNGRFLEVNDTASKRLGYSKSELVNMTIWDIDNSIEEQTGKDIVEQITREGTASFETQHLTKNGETLWVEVSLVQMEYHATPALLGVARDTTERKRLEESLRESEAHYRFLADNIQDVVFSHALQTGYFTYASLSIEKVLGYTPEEALSMTNQDILVENSYARQREAFNQAIENGDSCPGAIELEAIHKKGHTVPVEAHPTLIRDRDGTPTTAVSVIRDIRDRKRLEQELRASERTLRLLADNAHDVIALYDPQFRLQYIGPATHRFGYTVDEVLDSGILPVIYPDDRETLQNAFDHLLQAEDQTATVEHRIVTKSGTILWMETTGRRFEDEHGNPAGVVTVGRDITERRHAQEKLKESEQRCRLLAEHTVDIVYSLDEQLQPTYISPSVETLLGYAPGHFDHTSIFDFVVPEQRQRVVRDVNRRIAAGETFGITEFAVSTSGGNTRWVENRAKYLYDDDGGLSAVVGTIRDISDRKKTEEELQAALEQKDFLLRELNHRVKNNLRMVSSLVELKDSALSDAVDLSDIRHQVQAIEKVHASLQDSGEITHVRLRRYVDDILSTVFRSFTSQAVTIENHIPDISVRTKAAVPIGLIINETATNAIKHGFTGDDEAHFTVGLEADAEEENYVLTLSNTGVPLPENVDVENPQTLGLQLIQALVSQLQGRLEVQRTPSPVFTIRFPISRT